MIKEKESYNRRLTDQLKADPFNELDSFEDNFDEHVNEKWLISYADMMTLLFGLFVMLYTIAMDTQGHPEKVLSDIVAGRSSLGETKIEVENKEKEIQNLRKEKQNLTNQLNEKIKNINTLTDENTQTKNVITELETKIQKMKNEQEKNQHQQHQQQIIALNTEIQSLNSNLTSLKKEINTLRLDARKTNFMMVILNWTTTQHDIDLRITDPHGRMFDFQNREYKENKAKFIVDSRTGPGIEVWQTPEIESGDYKIEFNFYNAYGNKAPAVMTGSIITRKGVFEFPQVELDFSKSRKKEFKIKASNSGAISIQPL